MKPPAWRRIWEEIVGVDVRSLAALRVSLAAVVILDIFSRLRYLEAHYADSGVLPRADLLEWKTDSLFFSVHLMSGLWWVQGLIFLAALATAVMMLLGRHTRLMTVLTWFLLASVQSRNPLILHGGDQILRMMLFWAMFVPLGRVASLDALLEGRASDSETATSPRIVSVATLALKLQLCGMYWISAMLKWHPVWVEDYTAVNMALHLDQLVTPFGRWLTNWPEMLMVGTAVTMVLETLGPALAFSPIKTAHFQLFTVVLFVGFHLFGLAPALYLGIFPFVCAAGWMMFLPSRFWDRWWPAWQPDVVRRVAGRVNAAFRARTPQRASRASFAHGLPGTHYLTQAVVLVLLLYVVLWNLRTTDYEHYKEVFPPEVNSLAEVLYIGQLWNLFAPFPSTVDGWYVYAGTFENGDEIELLTGGPVSFEKPKNVSKTLGTNRWKKYHMNLDERHNGRHRRFYGTYLCSKWNRGLEKGERLASIKMHVIRERTNPDGSEDPPTQGVLWNQVCVLEDTE